MLYFILFVFVGTGSSGILYRFYLNNFNNETVTML